MKKISVIRNHLKHIPEVFRPIDPELTKRGETGGIETIWSDDEDHSLNTEAPPTDLYDGRPNRETEETDLTDFEDMFEFAPEIEKELQGEIFGDEKGEEIKKAAQVTGVDALGWYVSYHHIGAQWGIYISTSGILYMLKHVLHNVEAPVDVKLRMAIRAIHQHELFHFACDYMVGQLELMTGYACWTKTREYLKDDKEAAPPDEYPGSKTGYFYREEGLANANMIRSFRGRKGKGKTKALQDFVKKMGPGYRDGGAYVANETFKKESSILGGLYLFWLGTGRIDALPHNSKHNQDTAFFRDVLELNRLYPEFPIDWRYCPIHFVHDHELYNVPPLFFDFLSQIPEIVETRKFIKKLQRLPIRLSDKWNTIKRRLAYSVAGYGIDFKLFNAKERIYSLRLSQNYRVHLQHDKTARKWYAKEVGTHTEMKHD